MGKMPDKLREIIARNIRASRKRRFPDRGGGKRCAEAFGVSPQQWSPWESGKRTPDETRLEQIALFFGSTVEWFRRDHSEDDLTAPEHSHPAGGFFKPHIIRDDSATDRLDAPPRGGTIEDDITHYLWLMDFLTRRLTANGIKVVVTFESATETESAAATASADDVAGLTGTDV